MTQLTDILQRVERSLFERLRLETVDKGYIPDSTTFANNPTGQAAFDAALATVVTTKGFAIMVYGVGSNKQKGLAKVPRITILEEERLPGALGTDPGGNQYNTITNPSTGDIISFDSLSLPPQTKDLQYKISLIYETAEQGRVLHGLLALALPTRGYIPFYDDVTTLFFIKQISFSEMSYTEEGYRSADYLYSVEDIYDSLPTVLRSNIAPVQEITVETNLEDPNQATPNSTQVIS